MAGTDASVAAADLRQGLSSAQGLLVADVRGWLEGAWCSAVHNTVLQVCWFGQHLCALLSPPPYLAMP